MLVVSPAHREGVLLEGGLSRQERQGVWGPPNIYPRLYSYYHRHLRQVPQGADRKDLCHHRQVPQGADPKDLGLLLVGVPVVGVLVAYLHCPHSPLLQREGQGGHWDVSAAWEALRLRPRYHPYN